MTQQDSRLERFKECLAPLGFKHPHPKDFIRPKWNRDDEFNVKVALYGVFRLVVALYLLFWFIWTKIKFGLGSIMYLTTQGFLLITIDAFLQSLLIFWYRKNDFTEDLKTNANGNGSQKLPWLLKLSWLVTSLSSALALTITAGYWILLYRSLKIHAPLTEDLHIHFINTVYVLGSVTVAARPFRWQHLYIPALELVAYQLFAGIFYLSGGKNTIGEKYIYPFLTFHDPGPMFGFCSVILLGAIGLHLVLWALNLGVEAFLRRVCGKQRESEATVRVDDTQGTYIGKSGSGEDNLAFNE